MIRIISTNVAVAKTAWTLFQQSGYGISFMDGGNPLFVLNVAFNANELAESAILLERNGLIHFPEACGFDRFYIKHLADTGTVKIAILEKPSIDRLIYQRGGIPAAMADPLPVSLPADPLPVSLPVSEFYVNIAISNETSYPVTEGLPGSYSLEFISGYLYLATDGTVADRYLSIGILDPDSHLIFESTSEHVQVASKRVLYNLCDLSSSAVYPGDGTGLSLDDLDVSFHSMTGMSRLFFPRGLLIPSSLGSGGSIVVVLHNNQAADTLSGKLHFRRVAA